MNADIADSPFRFLKIRRNLASLSHAARPGRVVHRALLAEPAAVALARVCRFQFRFLSRRDEVSVLLKIFDDLFADHFTLKAAKCTFDRFVVIYEY